MGRLIDKLDEIHGELTAHRIETEKRLANIEADLSDHIRRTTMLEELYHDIKEDVDSARKVLNFLGGAAKVSVVLGALAGIAKVLKDFL